MPYLLIHIQTVLLLLGIGNLAILCMLMAWRGEAALARNYRYFMGGKALQALAWCLLSLRDWIPDLLSIQVANGVLIAGFAMEALALNILIHPSRRRETTFALLAAGSVLVFLSGPYTPGTRIGIASLASAAIYMPAAVTLLRHGWTSRVRILLGCLYVFLGAVLALRAGYAFFGHSPLTLLTSSYVQTATFLTTFALMLLGGLAFLLLLRERDERLLAESEARDRNLVEMAREAILIIQDRIVVFANRQASLLFAIPLGELVGTELGGNIHVDDRERVEAAYVRRIEGGLPGEAYDFRCVGRDGHLTWVSISATRISWKGRPASLSLLTDITARKSLEQEREGMIAQLQQALAEVRTLSGLIPICACCKKIRDDSGYWNQLEAYLVQRTDAEFTHGICPECREHWIAEHTR